MKRTSGALDDARRRTHLSVGAALAAMWLSTAVVAIEHYATIAYAALAAGLVAWLLYALRTRR